MDDFLLEAYIQSFYALGNSDPNPPVGAVLVSQDNRIIGRGYTQPYGGPHAEVMAITDAQKRYSPEDISKSILYVTLEPCSHFGKTPPCTDLIISSKIKKVVIGSPDITEKVRGVEVLTGSGVTVSFAEKSKYKEYIFWTLDAFDHYQSKKKPRIWLKWAQDKNGFLGPMDGPSGPISGQLSREALFRFRKFFNGVLVTPGTVNFDFPSLNPRYSNKDMKFSLKSRVLNQLVNTMNLGYPDENKQYQKRFIMLPRVIEKNVDKILSYIDFQRSIPGEVYFFYHENEPIKMPIKYKDLLIYVNYSNFSQLMNEVFKKGCLNLLIEAGAMFCEDFIRTNEIDHLMVFESPEKLWSEGKTFSLGQKLSKFLDLPGYKTLYEDLFHPDKFYIFEKISN